MSTGPVAKLDTVDYKHRIIIPIVWDGKQVSFTSRDVTGRHALRYITCPKERELVNHKTILFGRQADWGETGIVVEGPFDVFRFGVKACGTFGVEYTMAQVRQMVKHFKRCAVIYDADVAGQAQADKLVKELRFFAVDAWKVVVKGDPGSMKQNEADHLVRQLL
jgi:DNA primase